MRARESDRDRDSFIKNSISLCKRRVLQNNLKQFLECFTGKVVCQINVLCSVGRFRRCGLVGKFVSLEAGYGSFQLRLISSSLVSALWLWFKKLSLPLLPTPRCSMTIISNLVEP